VLEVLVLQELLMQEVLVVLGKEVGVVAEQVMVLGM
jgi:hypothetical protein